MTPEIALQTAIRARLVATSEVTDLVAEAGIIDRNARPVPDPCIVIGEKTSRDAGDIARRLTEIFLDLHVWKKEPSTEGVTEIAGAIRTAIRASRLVMSDGFHCVDAYADAVRVLRDPDGLTSHAVVMIAATVEELS